MNGVSRMLLATKSAIIKLQELYFKHGNKKALQLKVTSGGCSGFQYNFSLANPYNNLRFSLFNVELYQSSRIVCL